MKKHQLLEKAMRDYPAGTKFKSKTIDKVFESTGSFYFDDTSKIRCLGNDHIVYSQYGWAEIVKPSIVDGKVAIQVNNEREFKLLMEHYESKHFISGTGNNDIKPIYPVIVPYEQSFWCRYYEDHCRTHSIITFADFAAEVGIKVPVKIMVSQDGVDLYEGDEFYHVHFTTGTTGWKENISNPVKKYQETGVLTRGHINKAFSTHEAAEKWIEEQNKPKSKEIALYNGGTANVYADHIVAHGGIRLMPSDLEDMLHAYKSLQQ